MSMFTKILCPVDFSEASAIRSPCWNKYATSWKSSSASMPGTWNAIKCVPTLALAMNETMPVVALLPRDRIFEKTLSNVQEARARRSPIIAVATEGDPDVPRFADDCIFVPGTEDELTPFLTVIPLQYFTRGS